jgi:tRNA(Ile)-lysidine synthase TilS/MesJ
MELSGMSESSITNGVLVWRPLLGHSKEEIYNFAHKYYDQQILTFMLEMFYQTRYGVPYFKDSTPSWSTRGKLRSKLIPLLIDMYGEGCLKNLSSLALESDQYRQLVHQNIYDPFLKY